MVRVGIIGISGYTGEELIKILVRHPEVKISRLSSRSLINKRIDEVYPYLHGKLDLPISGIDYTDLASNTDLVFLSLPHQVSLSIVPELITRKVKVIDLSADYRLKNPLVYRQWYGKEHPYPDLLSQSVYGLPELYRMKIKQAILVANPGCYPTSVILALLPVLKNKFIDTDTIIIDAKSGVSGAGRKFVSEYYETEHPNCRPYKIAGTHRHIPEIEQELTQNSGREVRVTFTPHIIPVDRGMLTVVYGKLTRPVDSDSILNQFKNFYRSEPFIRILEKNLIPELRNVINTNYCELGVQVDTRTNQLIIVSAIDNLVKGAAGQAIQNMNLMCAIDETVGFV